MRWVKNRVVALVVSVFIAVGGWLVNEFFSRRAVRRNMRIEYLLSAYRRLEHASNRHMSDAHETALEEAISDIQLLGSRGQVGMATDFARQFAADQRADTEPLLEDLRASLRRELQLEEVPSQRMWLRITRGSQPSAGPVVGDRSWALWHDRAQVVETNILAAGVARAPGPPELPTGSAADVDDDLGSVISDEASPFVQEMLGLAHSSPIAAVAACHQRIGEELRRLLGDDGAGDISGLNITELAYLAHERSLINDATRNGVEGLGVLHTMSLLDEGGRRLDEAHAREYVGLTEGLLLALRMPPHGRDGREESPTAGPAQSASTA